MIGDFLKSLRTSQGFTQGAVADKMQSTKDSISRAENGQRSPTWEWIEKYAEAAKLKIVYSNNSITFKQTDTMSNEDKKNRLQEMGYSLESVTSNATGYPENVGAATAVLGFNDYAEIQVVADELQLRSRVFWTRKGWDLWVIKGERSGEFDASDVADEMGPDYMVVDAADLANQREATNWDDLTEEETRQEVDRLDLLQSKLNENKATVAYCGHYYDTLPLKMMKFSADSQTWEIGLVIFADDEE